MGKVIHHISEIIDSALIACDFVQVLTDRTVVFESGVESYHETNPGRFAVFFSELVKHKHEVEERVTVGYHGKK
jgi:hypothetical protein